MRHATTVATILAVLLTTAFDAGGEEASLTQTLHFLTERLEQLERDRETDRRHIRELEQKLEQISAEAARESRTQPAQAGTGQGNLLNPGITAFFDMGATLSSEGDNEAANRFNLRETELDLRAAVSPRADGVLIIAMGEEIETDMGSTRIATEFAIEEAYLDVHTLSEDLALKAGKFRNAFGRNNLLHTHDLPQVSRPLAVESFLGPEGLATVGASLSWIVPNPWDRYMELTTELVNADGAAESPILGGPSAENPAILGHLKLFADTGETASLEVGSSFLYGRTSDDRDSTGYLFGLDATYQWKDPRREDSRSLLFQTELIWSRSDLDDSLLGTTRLDRFGGYAFGQYQFAKSWYAGLRYDYTEFPSLARRGDSSWAASSWLTWYVNEALRLRLEYQHMGEEIFGRHESEELLLLGLTFYIGAHPPHPYWVNR